MPKRKYFFLIFFLIIIQIICIININFVYGVGIGQFSTDKKIVFQPGLEKNYMFLLTDSSTISASIEGDLAPYTTLTDPNPGKGVRSVTVKLQLPDYLEPGSHIFYIVATDTPDTENVVGGVASVRTGVEVFSLYPGKYPIFDGIVIKDVNVGDKTDIGISLTNKGEEIILDAKGNLTVYDPKGKVIAFLNTESKSISPFETQTMLTTLDTSLYNLSPGTFSVSGTATYDGTEIKEIKNATFIVGKMNMNIVSSTPELIVNATNKYYIDIESDWTGDINNVYGRIILPTGKNVRTPNVDVIKKAQGIKANSQLEAYIETDGLSLGEHEFDITLFYNGFSSNQKVKVNIVDGIAPVIEKPASGNNSKIIFIGVAILLIIIIVGYFFIFRREPDSSSKINKTSTNYTTKNYDINTNNNSNNYNNANNSRLQEQQTSKNYSDDDIKPPSL